MSKIFKSAICSLIVFATICAVLSVHALAATTVSVLNGQVSITDTATNMSESGGTVTVKAKGGLLSQTTNTITITNKSGKKAKLSFSYSASNYSSFSQPSANGNYSTDLEADASVTMFIKGKRAISSNTATLTLSGFSLVAIAESSNVTFDYDSTLGSITVAGNAVSSGGVVNISSSGAALVATPTSGAKFLGWVDAANNSVLSTAASYTLAPAVDMTVKAAFAKDGGTPWFGVGTATRQSQSAGMLGASKIYYHTVNVSYLFDNLNNAAQYASANSSKNIVLMNSGTLTAGDYTIPAGVTLLVPYDAANTMYTTEVQYTDTYAKPTEYRTLTMADGAKLVINGGMSVSAKQKYAAGGSTYGGMPVGNTGFVRMNSGSSITVNNGGALYAYGYVIGSGSVTAKSGATVYEGFQIMDFRGGDQSTGMKNRVFPLSQYYVQNIEVPLTLEAGAAEYAYTWMYMSSSAFGSAVKFIGSDAMFKLSSGTIKKYYEASTDRLMIEVDGDLSISSVSLSFASGLGTKEISSESYVLGLNGNISVDIKSGTTTVDQDIAMQPGAHMTIGENASVVMGQGKKLYVYDSVQWGTYVHLANTNVTYVRPLIYAPTREPQTITDTESVKLTNANMTDASILVEGTLDASKGSIYTTKSGAQITGSEGGKIITIPGTDTVTYQLVKQSEPTYDEIPITPVKLINSNKTVVETGNGAADKETTYTYTNGFWICSMHIEVVDAAEAATCINPGKTEGKHCKVCFAVTAAQQPVDALGHSAVEDPIVPYCFNAGKTAGSHCSVCDEILVPQIDKEPIGHHSWNAGTCDVCKAAFTIYGTNVAVNESLDLYFYVRAADVKGLEGALYADIVKDYEDSYTLTDGTPCETKVEKIEFGSWTTDTAQDGTPLLRFSFSGIAAKEMTDDVTVVIRYNDGDKEASAAYTETIWNYAHRLHTKSALSAELSRALADMLYYGAACQQQFQYNLDKPADAVPAAETGYKTDLLNAATQNDVSCDDGAYESGLHYFGTTVSAKNQLMISFYYDFGENGKPEDVVAWVSYTDHKGNAHNHTVDTWFTAQHSGKTLHGLDIKIPIASGRSKITVDLKSGGNVISTVSDSIESYASVASGTTAVTMQYMMRFVDSASAYFATLN